MNPSSDTTPGLGLPPPAANQGAAISDGAALPPSNAEQPAAPTQPISASPPAPDENTDALDQEWINKAKAIVDKTKHDPFAESRELGRIKADYLKTRYNKDIKVAEDHS
jgi:hypothetical protein